MAYNRKQHLCDNILAIQTAFELEASGQIPTKEQQEVLKIYSGFGGLTPVLKPYETEEDLKDWNESDLLLLDDVRNLYDTIRINSPDEQAFQQYQESLKNSVLTAFYTPPEIVEAISQSLLISNINPVRFLDPSSGSGIFIDYFKNNDNQEIHAFEKDMLTGKIAKALYPGQNIEIAGFESIRFKYTNYFDVVSSNIPYGNFSVFDPAYTNSSNPVKKAASQKIHNYFFLKSLDCLREGGVLAFIAPRGVMDSPDNRVIREWLVERSHLLSAIRLPDRMFAENANTRVGSDLIVLQKDSLKSSLDKKEKLFIETWLAKQPLIPEGRHTNRLFMSMDNIIYTKMQVYPDNYGKPANCFLFEGSDKELGKRISSILISDLNINLNQKLFKIHLPDIKKIDSTDKEIHPELTLSELFHLSAEETSQQVKKKRKRTKKTFTGIIEPFHVPDMLVYDEERIGKLGKIVAPNIPFTELKVPHSQRQILIDYIRVRDSYLRLQAFEEHYQIENESLRKDFQLYYKNFTLDHGDLNSKPNVPIILLDRFGREMLSLERFKDGKKTMADIYYRPAGIKNNLVINNINDAFIYCLNRLGKVNLEYMSHVSDFEIEKLKKELSGRIFYNPLSGNYEIREKFISGDVLDKGEKIEKFIRDNPEHPEMQWCQLSLKALQDAKPEYIAFHDLDFNLGERWLPTYFYSRYASYLFNTPSTVDYIPELDRFFVNTNKSKVEVSTKWGIKTAGKKSFGGDKVLEHALMNVSAEIKKKVKDGKGGTIEIPDIEASREANIKIEEVRTNFILWLHEQPEADKKLIADLYNRMFNSRVKPVYDGDFLSFPDLNLKNLGIDSLYSSQKAAIWLNLVNEGGIVDHQVGLGKTLIMCIIAYEMKRLGLANKPTILAMKANVSEIAECFHKAYPNAKILFPSENDFSPENRVRLFNQIRNNDWDAVIMTHEQFVKIPPDLETERKTYQEELDSITENLKVYLAQTNREVSPQLLRGLRQRQTNLNTKLADIKKKMDDRKDDILNFSALGIDHLLVDESHRFKNLMYNTRFYNISGLGTQKGSQQALCLYLALQYLQNKKDKDLQATFLSGTPISNSLVEMYLLMKYLRPRLLKSMKIRSFDAWAAVFAQKSSEFEFSVTSELKPKERFRKFIKVPELSIMYSEITDYRTGKDIKIDRPEGNIVFVKLPSTPQQKEFLEKLILFGDKKDGKLVGRGPLTQEEEKAIMLLITDYGRKMALDMRLIDPVKYKDEPDNKVNTCARNLAQYYKDFNAFKGTQLVFSDLGTYKADEWNLFSAIRDILVKDYNIPANEIAFIGEATTRDQRNEVFKAVRNGDKRIIFGSTPMMGTGVNVQNRVVAIHHLDIPWKPAEYDQRNGRGPRAGNWVAKLHASNKVDILVYATEESTDTFKFNVLKNKQYFINQFREGNLTKRTIDEGEINDDGVMAFDVFMAAVANDPDLMEKLKLERQIESLYYEFKIHRKNIDESKARLDRIIPEIDKLEIQLNSLHKDWKYINLHAPLGEDYKRIAVLNLISNPDLDEKGKGERLKKIQKKMNTDGKWRQIGSILDLPVSFKSIEYTDGFKEMNFSIKGNLRYQSMNQYFLDFQNPSRSFMNLLERIPASIKNVEQKIMELKAELPVLREIASTPWKKDKLLTELNLSLKRIEKKIYITQEEKKKELRKNNADSNEDKNKEKESPTVKKRVTKKTRVGI